MDWAAVALSGLGAAAEPVEVVPAGELLEGLPEPPVLERGELVVKPAFEQRQVVVARCEDVVGFEQGAHMLDAAAGRERVQALVGEGDLPGGQAGEQVAHCRCSQPGDEALRSVGADHPGVQAPHRRVQVLAVKAVAAAGIGSVGLSWVQELGELGVEDAAGAGALAVVLGLDAAAGAGQVGDAGAVAAAGVAGVGAAGEQPAFAAGGA